MGEVVYMPPRGRDQVLRKKDLAERWKVSTRWIEKRVKDAGLPMHKDGPSRLVWFSWMEVEQWRAGREVP